jgi:hypothetical protein
MEPEAKVVYLFCFARPGLEPNLVEAGMDGHSRVRFCHFAAATAVISELPLDEFRGPSADARMQDLAWVGPRACRHEQVIEAIMAYSPVLPVPFGTLFSSVGGLQQFIRTHAPAISRFLVQAADQEEWAVKGFLVKKQAEQSVLREELATHADQLAALSPGKRYIEEQRLQKEAAKNVSGRLQVICRTLAEDLRQQSSGFEKRRILDLGEAKDGGTPIFNWAFLLPKNAVERFREQVRVAGESHAAEGLRLELSGPWPPYSFAPCLVNETRE